MLWFKYLRLTYVPWLQSTLSEDSFPHHPAPTFEKNVQYRPGLFCGWWHKVCLFVGIWEPAVAVYSVIFQVPELTLTLSILLLGQLGVKMSKAATSMLI